LVFGGFLDLGVNLLLLQLIDGYALTLRFLFQQMLVDEVVEGLAFSLIVLIPRLQQPTTFLVFEICAGERVPIDHGQGCGTLLGCGRSHCKGRNEQGTCQN
jgi:hypothetical protein